MSLAAGRRRLLHRHGQAVTITRGAVIAAGRAVLTRHKADDLVGSQRQGDASAEISAADFANLPGGPRNPDEMLADGISYTVIHAHPKYAGRTLIGWSLDLRGG